MCNYGKYFENACFNKMTNFNHIHCISWPHKLIQKASDTAFFEWIYQKLAIFSIHGMAAYKAPYPFYLADILFLQLININILLQTFIALILKLSFLCLL